MGALDAYIGWWRIFPFKWYIETGTPIGLATDIDSFRWGREWVVFMGVPLTILVCTLFVVWRVRSRRPLRTEDWVAVALALGNLLFFQKALNRPDNHVYQSFITSIPLMYYVVVRGLSTFAESVTTTRGSETHPLRRTTVWFLTAGVVAMFPFMPVLKSLNSEMSDAGKRWKPLVSPPSNVERVGYSVPTAFTDTATEVRDLVDSALGKDAQIFDFANASGLYNFILDKKPITRFSYAVQMSTRPAMREVIDALRQRAPEVVAFSWDSTIDEWDRIPNSIRHYDLGEYILRNYTPWVEVGRKDNKQRLMLRNDLKPGYLMPADAPAPLSGTERTDWLMAEQKCDWGYAGNFLTTVPKVATRLKAEPVLATVTAFGWAHTDTDDPIDVAVLVDGKEVFRGPTTPNRADIVERGVATGANSGFYFDIPVVVPVASKEQVTIASVASDGSLVPLPIVAKPGVNDATGEYDVRLNQAVDGRIPIGGGEETRYVMRLEFPGERTDWSWVVVRSAFGFAQTNFSLYDKALEPDRAITFRAMPRSHVTGGLMAACPKWFAWPGNVLYLEYDHQILDPEVWVQAEKANR